MSKMTDYQSGREDGMLLAEQLVKDGGLERLKAARRNQVPWDYRSTYTAGKKRAGESFGADQDEHIGHGTSIGDINNP